MKPDYNINELKALGEIRTSTGGQTLAGSYDPSAKDCCARELTAREALTNYVQLQHRDTEELLELLKALPQELPYRADRALRTLIQKASR